MGGEKVEEHEQAAGKLTGDRFGAEDGRKVVVDERGEARGGASMVDGGLVRDFGRVGLGRARGWSEWVDGEAAQLWVRRIEAGRRDVAGATNGGDSARLRSHELEDGDGRGGRDGAGRFEGVREVKSGAHTRWPTRGSSPPATVAGMASGVIVTNTVETLFLRLNDFCPSLTS